MECAGRAKRRRRFGCCEALAQLKAPSPLRSAGALQMVLLARSALKPGELEVLLCMQSGQGIVYPKPKHSYVKDYKARKSIALADSGTPDR